MTSILFVSSVSRLTQVLEDFQKVLTVNIDDEDEKTLEKISQDVSTLRRVWQKIRNNPTQALSGRTFSLALICLEAFQILSLESRSYLDP